MAQTCEQESHSALDEVDDARKNWSFKLSSVNSVTSKEGKLLILRGLERVGRRKYC